jgi:hypothetical protein
MFKNFSEALTSAFREGKDVVGPQEILGEGNSCDERISSAEKTRN